MMIIETQTIGKSVVALTEHKSTDGIVRFKLTWSVPKNNMSKSLIFTNGDIALMRYNTCIQKLQEVYQSKAKSAKINLKEVMNDNN